MIAHCRLRLKCDGTRSETRLRLSTKRRSPFKSAGVSVQSTAGSRVVRISGSNAGYAMFRGSVKGTVYPLHSLISPSLPFPCVTVCHHVSAALHRRLTTVHLGCKSNQIMLNTEITDVCSEILTGNSNVPCDKIQSSLTFGAGTIFFYFSTPCI